MKSRLIFFLPHSRVSRFGKRLAHPVSPEQERKMPLVSSAAHSSKKIRVAGVWTALVPTPVLHGISFKIKLFLYGVTVKGEVVYLKISETDSYYTKYLFSNYQFSILLFAMVPVAWIKLFKCEPTGFYLGFDYHVIYFLLETSQPSEDARLTSRYV